MSAEPGVERAPPLLVGRPRQLDAVAIDLEEELAARLPEEPGLQRPDQGREDTAGGGEDNDEGADIRSDPLGPFRGRGGDGQRLELPRHELVPETRCELRGLRVVRADAHVNGDHNVHFGTVSHVG